eukprot:TRINITY_DN12473_c0_g1_i3.p1 TRINITY_DN12473_c0_g1~~TRINITY_DN12473_c0_g1_i3.p1  ORF type:complete len:1160 (+),score=227.89 TRINITY_DN12473_c0_g1_i3:55-3480(+)
MDTETGVSLSVQRFCSDDAPLCLATEPLNINERVRLMKATLSALSYRNAMLLTNDRCSWLSMDERLRTALIGLHSTNVDVSFHAHGFGAKPNVNCGDLEHAKYSTYWLLPTSSDQAVSSLLDVYRAGGLGNHHWMLFDEAISAVTVESVLDQLAVTTEGVVVADWLRNHTLVVSSLLPLANVTSRLAALSQSAVAPLGTSPELARLVDSLRFGLQVLNAADCSSTTVELVLNTTTPSAQATQLTWTGPGFDQADHYVRTLSTGIYSQTRATIKNTGSGFAFEFHAADGQPASRPYLMLDGNPELYPVDSLPVKLPLVTAFGRSNPILAEGSPALSAFAMAATEFFNAKHAGTLDISMALRTTFPNQCTGVAKGVIDQPFVGVCGAVVSECTIRMMEEYRHVDMPCISSGSTSALLENITRYNSFFRMATSSSRLGRALALLVAATPFRCVANIVEPVGQANAEVLASFNRQAAASGISIAQFDMPVDPTDTVAIRAMLMALWDHGVGVIVVHADRTHVGNLMQMADELGMLDVDFLWIMGPFASVAPAFTNSVARKLEGRVLTPKSENPGLTSPLGQEYSAFQSSWSHQSYSSLITGQGYTVRAADIVNLYVLAALDQLHTYGFGMDVNRTRASLLKGLKRVANHGLAGITQATIAFDRDQNAIFGVDAFTMRDSQLTAVGAVVSDAAIIDPALWSSRAFSCQAPPQPIAGSDTTAAPVTQQQELSHDALAGLLTAIAALVILVVLVLFTVARRRANDPAYRAYDFKPLVDMLTLKMRLDHHGVTPTELPRRVVKYDTEKRLGKGKFGTVYAGLVKERGEVRQVAVKVLRGDATSASAHQLRTEAVLLSQFESQEHIVNAIGVVTVGAPMLLVMELCNQGSLHDYLNEQFSKNITVSWTEKLALCRQVAEGMQALAAANCIHTDLAARNILVHEGVAKVCDFGLSKSSHYYMSQSDRPVPVRWTAPEALDGYFSTPGDVWSFGVLMWEVAVNAQSLPYPSMGNQEVMQAVRNGYRLKCPLLCPQPIYHIMLSCWAEVDRRPTFAQLCRGLEGLSTVNYDNQNVEQEVVNRSRSMTAAPDLHSFHIHLPTAGAPSAEPAVHGQKRSGYVPRDQLSRDQYLARNQAERKKLVERRDYDRLTVL